uniref:Major facilitator superfamily (MFS) profile domain-containing protein n=1 Tax=Onchocerca volvulus TaxID=6282 RepID=A0A8R1XTG9_ONCVO
MTNKKSVNPVRNDAWFTEGTQGDVGGDSPPVVVNTSQSSSKLLPGAENNSKRNGHANPDDTKVHNDENIDDKCNHDNAVIHDCCSDKVGLEEGNLTDVLPIPPDGGYGWVIVFAAFMSNFVVDGIANSFGAFMSIYQDYFNASKALVSLIGSLLIGCYLLIGPIVGGLVNKYGARMVVIIGSFVAGLSFLASLFCSNIYMFMIFYGILGVIWMTLFIGAGFGLIYLPSIVTVGYYFEKKRSIATGLAVAGSGVGTFVLPPLCIVLINQFGWKIAVCSLSALSFSSIIYGLLYRPLQISAIRRKEENTKADVEELLLISKEKEWKPSREDNEDSAANENKHQKFTRIRNSQSECEMHEFDEMTPLSPTAGNMTGKNRDTLSNSSEELSTRARRDPTTSMKSKTASTDLKTSHGNLAKVLSKISVHSFTHSTSFRSRSSQMKDAQSLASITSNIDRKEFNKPLNRRDIFYSGSIRNLPEFKSEGGNYRSYRESQISIPTSAVVQAVADLSQVEGTSDMHHKFGRNGGTVGEQSEQLNELVDCYVDSVMIFRRCKWIPVTIRNILNEMIDISLLKEPTMFLLCISNLFGMLGFYVPFMFLIDMAVAKGHSKGSGSILLSVIGVTNTIGRIAFGWLADRGWLSALAINNFALLGCGVLTCLCPLLPGYGGLMVYSILFGFIISAYISLTSIVLVDELGLDRLTNSFGLLVVSRGIASLLGTPLAGVVYDVFDSYDASFYFAGVIILLSGLVSCLIPAVRRCRHNESAKETVEEARMIDEDIQSEKLSVLTEHTEENLTEHQRTVQSLRQKQKFLERRTND